MAILSNVEHSLIEVIRSGRGHIFDKIKLAHLMRSELIVKQIVTSVLSSTKLISPMAKIVWHLADKSYDHQCVKNLDKISTPTILTELSQERSSSDRTKSSKLSSANKIGDLLQHGRCLQNSSHRAKKGRLKSPTTPFTDSDI